MEKYNSIYNGKIIDTNISKFYNCLNTLIISYTPGVRIILKKGSKILTATEDNGVWTFHPDEFGTWEIWYGLEGEETHLQNADVLIDSIAIRTINLL